MLCAQACRYVKRVSRGFLPSYVREKSDDKSNLLALRLHGQSDRLPLFFEAAVLLAACKTLECKGNKRDMQSFEHPSVR